MIRHLLATCCLQNLASFLGCVIKPNENQDFGEEKFKELDSDQIEGGEFEFLGLELRFERNREIECVEIDFEFWKSISVS